MRGDKMTVLAYMAEQKAKIRARHSGEEFFFQGNKDKNAPVKLEESKTANAILEEIDEMEGLNREGRGFSFRVRAHAPKNGFAV